MPGGNKKINIDIGVNFKVEGQQLDQYVNKANQSIKNMQNNTGNANAFSNTKKALDEVVKEFDKLSKMKLNTENVGDYIRQQDKLRAAIEDVNKAKQADSANLTAKQEKYNKTLADATDNYNELAKKINEAKEQGGSSVIWKDEEISITKANNVLRGYLGTKTKAQKSLNGLKTEMKAQEEVQKDVNASVEQASSVLRENIDVQNQATKAEEENNKQQTLDAIKKKIQYYTSLAFSVRLVRKAFKEAIQTYQELDKSITSISMVSGLSRDTLWGQIGTYNDLAKQLGTTTGEVLNAAQLYYQQGRDTNSVIELTTESLKLAAIAGLETADATNYLTAAVNGYKMDAADANEVTDVWAQLAAKNAVSVKELSVAISKVASIAQSAGMDIQSTSAFLTQMISTTREAPENLGTALKTIIARFQELKTSTAALEDGVDANKVEKALKTVGISLRDTTGQFRDFDDVILELSSKWDSLDRNTQRYIATIAAGSRQQSRFIALVSDYEGLTKVMDQAANSQGAANEQFETYTEGLQAAVNRLKASWEGFYTSISKGHNIITGIINLLSKLIDLMSKMGIVGSAIVGGTLVKGFGTLYTALAKGQKISEVSGIIKTLTTFVKNYKEVATSAGRATDFLGKSFDAAVKTAGPLKSALQSTKVGIMGIEVSLGSLLATLAVVTVAVIAITAAVKAYQKEVRKPETWREEAQAAGQTADRYKDYADSIREAAKAGQDWGDIRKQLIAENYDFLKTIDLEKISTQELIKLLEEQAKQEEFIAMQKRASSALESQHQQETTENAKTFSSADKFQDFENNYNNTGSFDVESLTAPTSAAIDNINYAREIAENTNKLFDITKKGAAETAEGINYLTYAFNALGVEYDKETGLITGSTFDIDAYLRTIQKLPPELKDVFNQLTEGVNPYDVGLDLVNQLKEALSGTGFEDVISQFIQTGTNLSKSIETGFSIAFDNTENPIVAHLLNGLKNNDAISGEIQQSILDVFNNIDPEDSGAQQAFLDYINSIINIDPSLLTQDIVQAWGNADLMENVFNGLLGSTEDVNIDFLNVIKDQLGEVNAAFLDGLDAVNHYNNALAQLDKMTSGGNMAEYSAMVEMLASDWQELGFKTEDAARAAIWANTVQDESGQYMLQNGDLLEWLRNRYYDNAEAEAADARAALETAKSKLQANLTVIDGAIQEAETLLEKAKAEILADGQVSTQTLQSIEKQSGAWDDLVKNDLNPILESAGMPAIGSSKIATNASTSSGAAAIAALESQVSAMKNARSQIVGAINAIQSMQNQVTIPNRPGASSKPGGSKGSSKDSSSDKKSTEETKKLSEAMKEAADAASKLAKQMQTAAKAEIDAIKSVLEERKKLAEDRKKRAEDELEATVRHNKMYWEEYKKLYEDQLKLLEDKIKKEKQLLDDETDDINAILGYINDSYDNQIDTIQAKIDALDKEAEAEDRLRKLQEARDAYERARNQRTRLVLTQGAGWIFKTDTEALNQARTGLEDAQRDYQKAVLQDEIDKINDIKDLWAESAKNLGKSTEELEHQVDLMERAEEILKSGDVQTALNLFGNLVTANTARRDNYLATEKEYEKQSDENVKGSLAWQAARAEKMAEDAGRSKEEREEEKLRLQYIEDIKGQFPQITSDTAITADFLSNYGAEANKAYESYFGPRFDHFDKKRTELEDTIAGYEDEIKKYEDSIEEWSKIESNTDKSAADLEKLRQYSEMTFDELSKDSQLFKDWKKKIGDYQYKKDRYDISKQEGDEAWYKQLQKDIEDGKLTMTEQNYWLDVLSKQQEEQAEKEKEDEAAAAAQAAANGGSTGSVSAASQGITPSTSSSSAVYTPTSPSNEQKTTWSPSTPSKAAIRDAALSQHTAIIQSNSEYSAAQNIKVPSTTAAAAGQYTSGSSTQTIYNFNIQSQADTVRAVVKDADRYSRLTTGQQRY